MRTVSVIIPTYNRASYITDSIDSVLNQEHPGCKIDVVVVDDGSTDNTEKLLKPYVDNKNIRYFKIKHSGLPAVPRNYGLGKSLGEIIAFQDSDDLWPKDKLAKQLPVFDNPEIVLSYGLAVTIDKKGHKTHGQVVATENLIKGEKFKTLIQDNVISTLTVMARKKTILEAGNFNESSDLRAVEDYDLWLRIAVHNPAGLKAVKEVLAFYRIHDKNISKVESVNDMVIGSQHLLTIYNNLWDLKLSKTDRIALEERLSNAWESLAHYQKEMGETPKVTVLLTLYQAEAHLKPAVESILGQSMKDFELLVIDDGCTDKSIEIVKSYNDSRVKIVRQINHGLVYSLNKGVRLARSELIARHDADDISTLNRFDKELTWFNKDHRRALVGGFFTYIDEKSGRPSTTITSPTKHEDLRRMLRIVNPFAHGSVMVRREAILAAGGYRDTYGPTEDYDLWRRIAQNWQIGQIPEVLYFYRINLNSISHKNQEVQHKFADKISNEIWRTPLPHTSFFKIVSNAGYYKKLKNRFSHDIWSQYAHQQILLAFGALIRGKLLEGYETTLASFLIKPLAAIRLWKIILWAPFKLLLGKQVK